MQTKECVRRTEYSASERNEELIIILMAISVVSKKLAGWVAALEHRYAEKPRGGKPNEQNE